MDFLRLLASCQKGCSLVVLLVLKHTKPTNNKEKDWCHDWRSKIWTLFCHCEWSLITSRSLVSRVINHCLVPVPLLCAFNMTFPDESVGVEVFEDRESNKPLILLPYSNSFLPVALRRWRKVKHLTLASRRSTSLTKSEEHLLEKLQAKEEPVVQLQVDDELAKARDNLKQQICAKGHTLTPTERKFLIDLADCEHVSVDYLVRSAKVLFHDPIFDLDDERNTDDVPNSKGKASVRKRDASFRSEVWTHFSTSSVVSNRRNRQNQQSFKDEEKELEQRPLAVPRKGFMNKFFRKRSEKISTRKQEYSKDDDEDFVEFTILATSVDDKNCQPHVLSPPIMDALRIKLPLAVQQDNFWLKYSMVRDGASMRSLLQKIRSSARTVIAIETTEGDVFGAFTSSPWRPHGHRYYGSCEAFLWRMAKSRFTECATVDDQILLEYDLDFFPWSCMNRNIQYLVSADDHLVIGGGAPDDDPNKNGGCGLTIRADMSHGFSDPCFTFSSPSLPVGNPGDPFEIANLEVWALTPVETIHQAEKLEFGRQFVFDHGNFTQDI